MDVSKDTGIVDVSVKPAMVNAAATALADKKKKGEQAAEDGKEDKKKKGSKKRKAEEALDAAHASDSAPKVCTVDVLQCAVCSSQFATSRNVASTCCDALCDPCVDSRVCALDRDAKQH